MWWSDSSSVERSILVWIIEISEAMEDSTAIGWTMDGEGGTRASERTESSVWIEKLDNTTMLSPVRG